MHYELYLDTIFLINFVLNLYLLLLVNRGCMYAASRRRLLAGAAVGAGMYVLCFAAGAVPLLRGLPAWCRQMLFFVPGTVLMVRVTFRVREPVALGRIWGKTLCYSFFLGGGLLAAGRMLGRFPGAVRGMCAVLGTGALLVMGISYLEEGKEKRQNVCRATLINRERRITLPGLVDTGNGLVEPISGKPVSIIEQKTFEGLFGEEEMLYRAIPYHSIGRKRGILKGYVLPELWIEVDGITKVCRQVFVAVSEEEIGSFRGDGEVRMIVNPQVLQEG